MTLTDDMQAPYLLTMGIPATYPSEDMNEQPSFLLSLPTELIERIACHADDAFPKERPLSRLRSTCKQLCNQVSPEFAKRYLSEPFIMISRYSLQTLISICEHPIFGPYVRKVRLQAFPQFVREARNTTRFLKKVASHLRYHPNLLRLNPRVHADINSIVEADALLRSSGEAIELLSTAFKSLTTYQTPIVLVSEIYGVSEKAEAETEAQAHAPPIGHNASIMDPLFEVRRGLEDDNADCTPALLYLIRAASKTGCNVTGMDIHHCDANGLGSFSGLPLSSDETKLLCGIRNTSITIDGAYHNPETVGCLKHFLAHVKNTTQMRFHTFCHVQHRDYQCEHLGHLLRPTYLPKLQSLKLDGFVTSSNDLKDFLARHKGTLREIDITNIMIFDDWAEDGPLRELFAWVRDELTLKRVLIGGIYAVLKEQQLRCWNSRVPWHVGNLELEGESEIQSGLTDLCDEGKRLKKLFMLEGNPYSTDTEIPTFAAMSGLPEQDFIDNWCADGLGRFDDGNVD
ncbi:hypothetical protein D6D06_09620 [Aureobasidium pullulans]|nr:hypothetical protein D6D06_09620 [Aureobasidium pullulans]